MLPLRVFITCTRLPPQTASTANLTFDLEGRRTRLSNRKAALIFPLSLHFPEEENSNAIKHTEAA